MQLYPIETGNFKLDGGAMFGVVPKVLWERTNPADQNNRIALAARSLLIEHESQLIIIDAGLGNKQSEKFFSHYAPFGTDTLISSLRKVGFGPDDITDVLLTHLHFDHVGGATKFDHNGSIVPTFKNATYWVHEKHWEWAIKPNPRERPSFLPENLNPLNSSGQLKFITAIDPLIDDPRLPFQIILVDGHTEKQMLPRIQFKGNNIVFVADLIPTVGHLPIPYVTGYDVRPLVTLSEKKRLLNSFVSQNTLLFMEHDTNHQLISLQETEKGVRMNHSIKIEEL